MAWVHSDSKWDMYGLAMIRAVALVLYPALNCLPVIIMRHIVASSLGWNFSHPLSAKVCRETLVNGSFNQGEA